MTEFILPAYYAVVKKADIFEGQVHVVHTGKDFGSMNPRNNPNLANRFGKLLSITGQERFLVPRFDFETKVTPIDVDIKFAVERLPGFLLTPETSDGVIVSLRGETHAKIAVLMITADCAIGKILAPDGSLAVLHCMIDTVDHRDGSSIVTNAIEYFKSRGISPSELRFQIGEAARACCLDFKARSSQLIHKYGSSDIPLIAARQAEQMGIKDIGVEDLCTSCAGQCETWFSNLRQNDSDYLKRPRNAVVIYAD